MSSMVPRLPTGYGKQILYLDYDGVLHHENCLWHPKRGAYLSAPSEFKIFQNAELLEELLTPYPAVLIVLSTSWVRRYGVTRTAKRLPEGLRQRVIGATFHSEMDENYFSNLSRGLQVYNDILRRKPARFVAIDDVDEGWPLAIREHLVLTHEKHGISHPPVLEELKSKLASHFATDPRSTP